MCSLKKHHYVGEEPIGHLSDISVYQLADFWYDYAIFLIWVFHNKVDMYKKCVKSLDLTVFRHNFIANVSWKCFMIWNYKQPCYGVLFCPSFLIMTFKSGNVLLCPYKDTSRDGGPVSKPVQKTGFFTIFKVSENRIFGSQKPAFSDIKNVAFLA